MQRQAKGKATTKIQPPECCLNIWDRLLMAGFYGVIALDLFLCTPSSSHFYTFLCQKWGELPLKKSSYKK